MRHPRVGSRAPHWPLDLAAAHATLRLVPPERAAGILRRPARPAPAAPDAAPAAAPAFIPLGGPPVAERARRLRAAYDASSHDELQRQLLAEIIAHFRAWCEAHAFGDPFGEIC